MLLFQGVLLFGAGLCDLLFGSVRENIDGLMRKGEFDRLLLRPYPTLLLILTSGFKPQGFGSFTVGAGAVAWAWIRIGTPAGLPGLGLFVVFILGRALIGPNGAVFGQKTQLLWDLPASDSFALSSFSSRPVRSLSLGERMKCELAASAKR